MNASHRSYSIANVIIAVLSVPYWAFVLIGCGVGEQMKNEMILMISGMLLLVGMAVNFGCALWGTIDASKPYGNGLDTTAAVIHWVLLASIGSLVIYGITL